MTAAERASEASRAERANEWVVRANKRVDERMVQYSMRLFRSPFPHRALDENSLSKLVRIEQPMTCIDSSACLSNLDI